MKAGCPFTVTVTPSTEAGSRLFEISDATRLRLVAARFDPLIRNEGVGGDTAGGLRGARNPARDHVRVCLDAAQNPVLLPRTGSEVQGVLVPAIAGIPEVQGPEAGEFDIGAARVLQGSEDRAGGRVVGIDQAVTEVA